MSESRSKSVLALQMRHEGKSWEEIGACLGWMPSTAQAMASRSKRWEYHYAVKKQGEKRRRPPHRRRGHKLVGVNWTDEMREVVRSLWVSQTGDQIARILSLQYSVSLTRNAVISQARKMQLPPKPPYRPGWQRQEVTHERPDAQGREPSPFG